MQLVLQMVITYQPLLQVQPEDPLIVQRLVKVARTKLAEYINNEHLILEYGVAAWLDPRQRSLADYRVIWTDEENILTNVRREYPTFKDFTEAVGSFVQYLLILLS